MLFEITGAGFSNKGAQLMLATVCERLRRAAPEVRLCMAGDNATFADRATYGLYTTPALPTRWTSLRRVARYAAMNLAGRTFLRPMAGLVLEREIEGLIDVSGYAFGDKWPVKKTERLTRRAARCKRRGKPVILLPQMLGPFTKPGQADAFRKLADYADLVYARERESFEHALPLVDRAKLRLAPDITIPAPAAPAPSENGAYACIVPNSKLLERANLQQQDWSDYLDRLVAASEHLMNRGVKIKIVQHEYNSGDVKLVEKLRREIAGCDMVRHADPRALKAVLGGAELVIGSRFHSLVSTLSMGVPAIALGWAHKYDALLRDFGTPELIHRAEESPEQLFALIDETLEHREALVAKLATEKARMSLQVEKMWVEVFETLGLAQNDSKRGDAAAPAMASTARAA